MQRRQTTHDRFRQHFKPHYAIKTHHITLHYSDVHLDLAVILCICTLFSGLACEKGLDLNENSCMNKA